MGGQPASRLLRALLRGGLAEHVLRGCRERVDRQSKIQLLAGMHEHEPGRSTQPCSLTSPPPPCSLPRIRAPRPNQPPPPPCRLAENDSALRAATTEGRGLMRFWCVEYGDQGVRGCPRVRSRRVSPPRVAAVPRTSPGDRRGSGSSGGTSMGGTSSVDVFMCEKKLSPFYPIPGRLLGPVRSDE